MRAASFSPASIANAGTSVPTAWSVPRTATVFSDEEAHQQCLRACRRGRRAHGRGLRPAKQALVAQTPRKSGQVNEMPCHHNLESYLDESIEAASIGSDRTGPLFRSAIGKTKKLSALRMSRTDAWSMVRRRAQDAGIETALV